MGKDICKYVLRSDSCALSTMSDVYILLYPCTAKTTVRLLQKED